MKKYNYKLVLTFTLLSTTLSLEASYNNVYNAYQHNNYAQAITEAKNSFSEYTNPKLHLLWAKSAEKLGYTTEAMAAYERVLMFNPSNIEVKKALKTIYINTDRLELSNTILVQQDIKIKWHTHISMGYDSNIDINPGGSALDEYYNVTSDINPISTAFVRFNGNASTQYSFENRPKWFTKGSINLYNQTNFSASKYDLTKISLAGGIGYRNNQYHFYIPISYHKLFFFSKNLLSDYTISPELKVNIFSNTILDFGAEYNSRKYIDSEDQGRDSNSIKGNIGVYFPLINIPMHFDISHEKRTASEEIQERYISSTLTSFDANIQYLLRDNIFLNFHHILRYAQYNDDIGTAIISSDILRRDYISQTDFEIIYHINQKSSITLQETYTKSYSNYIPAEYSKNLFLVGFNYKF